MIGREPLVVAAGFSHNGELSSAAQVELEPARLASVTVEASVAVGAIALSGNAISS